MTASLLRGLCVLALGLTCGCSNSKSDSGTESDDTSVKKDLGYDVPDPGRDSPCVGQFGACVASADCPVSKGHLSSVTCDTDGFVCCTALDRCTGTEDFVCCAAGGQEFRPTCDAHAGADTNVPLDCPYGQKKGTHGMCPP